MTIDQALAHIDHCIAMMERYRASPHNLALLEGLRSERKELAAHLNDSSVKLSYAAARHLDTMPAWGYKGT